MEGLQWNINSLLREIDKIHFMRKQSSASITGISESKLDLCILNSELDSFIFVAIFLPKIEPTLVEVLYRPVEFIEYNSLKESSISDIQECFLLGDYKVYLLGKNKMLLKKQYSDPYSLAPSVVKKYIFAFHTPSIK